MSTNNDWQTALEIGAGVAKILGAVIDLGKRALAGDRNAVVDLKRVDQILTPTSLTEEAFQRADNEAHRKPPR